MAKELPHMSPMRVIDLNTARRQDQDEDHETARLSFAQCVEGFRAAMAAAGLGRPAIEPDGRIHRFDLPDERAGKKGGWYVFHLGENPCPAGAFGSWKHAFSETWSARANWELTSRERDRLAQRLREAATVRDAARAREAGEAAGRAAALLAAAPDATDAHPYLARKQIRALGLKLGQGDTLLAPMFDTAGRVRGLQRIMPGGEKRFLKGVDPKGAFGWIEGDTSSIYLAEGYATGASLHMATGRAVALAFNAGNLEPAARAVKEVFPQATVIVAADNDRWTTRQDGTPWNVGVEKAHRAAEAIGARVIIPEFADLAANPTDFNDLHRLEGLNAVRSQTTGRAGPVITDWDTCLAFQGEPPTRQWLVHGVFPRGQVSLVAAAGGVGKSFMLLALARDAAAVDLLKPSHFGGPIQSAGQNVGQNSGQSAGQGAGQSAGQGASTVVYLAAEDDSIEIHGRLHSLGGPVRGLYAVPLPTAGGAEHFFRSGPDRCPATTPAWDSFVKQVKRLPGLSLIILDPLQPLCALDLNLPEAAQFVCSKLSQLAAECNAAVILSHHFRKTEVHSPEEARQAIRGTAGLVDGVRSVYALWPVPDDGQGGGKATLAALNRPFTPEGVVRGCVVKGNGVRMTGVRTFVREPSGVLIDCTPEFPAGATADVLPLAREAIAAAAQAGRPYTKWRENGLFERRHELPEALRTVSKRRFPELVDELLQRGEIVVAMAAGAKTVKWLDIPSGPFAAGSGSFAPGFNEARK